MTKLSLSVLTTPLQNWGTAREQTLRKYRRAQAAISKSRLGQIPALIKHPAVKRLYSAIYRHAIQDGRWLWVLGVPLASGIFHILIILNVPGVASRTAWDRLANVAPINQMYILPRVSEKPLLLPFMAPDIRYALCRFDLTTGPVRVKAPVQNANWSIAVYSRTGDNFYSISGADLRRVQITMVIVSGERAAEAEADVADASEELVIVKSPHRKGILLIRAPLSGQSYDALTENAIRKAGCSVQGS
jgi:uncharacterized membrane protein